MQIGDVVLVQDSNVIREKWRMGLVASVYPDESGKVRTVQVQLKNEERNGKSCNKPSGTEIDCTRSSR